MPDDVWSSVLFAARYGDQPLEILTTRDSFRRALVLHAYPRRDGARIADMGAEARSCDARIVFRDPPGLDLGPLAGLDHVERARRFVDAANEGIAREFVHPVFGSFPAMILGLEIIGDGERRDYLEIQASIVEQGLDPAPLAASTSRQLDGGAPLVAVEAAQLEAAAAQLEPAAAAQLAAVAATATATADAWDGDADGSRNIAVELERATSELDRAIDELDLLASPDGYPAFRAAQRLRYQLARAAAAAQRTAPALLELVTAAAAPLATILADVYGAGGGERRADALRLNRIRDPMLVDAGARLILPAPAPLRTQRTRRQGPAYGR